MDTLRSTEARGATAARRSRTRTRALGVAGAVLAALATWVITGAALGADLQVAPGTDQPQSVSAGSVLVASLLAGLVGWGALALLERRTPRARRIWTVLALAVLALSLAPAQAGVTTADTMSLAAMHLAVAAVLVPALAGFGSEGRTA